MIILSSASKIVFIILAIALCVFTYFWIVDGKDFTWIVSMVFVYYFNKNINTPPDSNQTKE